MMTCLIRVSFLTTLVIYNVYFKSHYTRKQRPRTHILYVKLLHLYALGFCNQVLSDLHFDEVKNFETNNDLSSC